MDTKTAPAYVGLSVQTLTIKRSSGTGPKFRKAGEGLLLQRRLRRMAAGQDKRPRQLDGSPQCDILL